MSLRRLGLALLAPLLLAAGAPGRTLYLNGQPLPGPAIVDGWIPLERIWALGVAATPARDATAWALPSGERVSLRWYGGKPAVAIDDLARFGIRVQGRPDAWLFTKPLAALKRLAVEADDMSSRIVWETDQPVSWRWREDGRHLIVEIGGAGGSWPTAVAAGGLIKGLKLEAAAPGVLRLQIERRYPTPVDLEGDGRRFELRLPHVFSIDDETPLAGEVIHHRHYGADEAGPLSWHLLRIPRTSPYRVQVLTAEQAGRFGKAPVSRLAAQAGAAVAINAGYFAAALPVGLLMQSGQVLTSPIYNRTLLALPSERPPFISRTQLSLEILAADGQSAEIDWVNYPRQRNSLAAYTDRYGARTGTKVDGPTWEVAVDAWGRVSESGPCDLAIPPGGVVLAGQGPVASWMQRSLKPGELAVIRSKLASLWPDVSEAIAGGPTLVRDGQVVVTSAEEKFQPDIAVGRAPRTAVGLTAEGDWLWLVVDGRDPAHSRGLTLQETGELLLELGATQAMNLDGGGSTTLVIDGAVVNKPSDGRERPVSTALGLVPVTASRR